MQIPYELLIGVLLTAILVILVMNVMKQPSEPKVVVIEQPQQQQPDPPVLTSTVLPYWTMYGAPSYWPTYLSPYWFYDVPFGGPITGSGGYYRPHGPRHGYSGVAVGGGGGGHGGH
jgi:hypothetical protein